MTRFGKKIVGMKHWEFAERKRIELRRAIAAGDHNQATKLCYEMRVNFDLGAKS